MPETPSYENLPIEEFAKLPGIIQLYANYSSSLENALEGKPFIRIAKIIRGDFAILYADSKRYADLLEFFGNAQAELLPEAMGLLGIASLEASAITQVQQQPYLNLKGRDTLVGVISTGIDYTKEAFRKGDGSSRVHYIWDQTIIGNRPQGYVFGTEFTNEEINQALEAEDPFSKVPSHDHVGHGTFLASVAASNEENEYLGAAPEADLIVVKLRPINPFFYDAYYIPESVENIFSAADVMLAIEYMIEKANTLKMPVSICLGLGSNMSGHDGFSVLDQYISNASQITGVCICAGAGNESTAGHHTSGTLAATNDTYDIQVRVPENADRFMFFVFANSADRYSVSGKSPLGESIPRIPAISGQERISKLVLERASVKVTYYFPIAASGVELISIGISDPTPGTWTFTLHGDIVVDGRFHAWLHLTGLITPGIEFLNPDPRTTIVMPGTSPGAITSGAYDDRNNSLYINSSWGFTRNMLIKPDLTAPGVEVSGIFPIGSGTMSGTSVATAITCGACALMLQWGIVNQNEVSLNTNRIKAYLIRGCKREANMQYPNAQWGYGRLDLFNSFRLLQSF